VIDDDGTMLGVFSPQEALRMAEDKGLDLIEIAPTAKPPTCKITDYGKYKYEAKKKEHQARKNQTVITIKEVQLRPRTDQHDLDVKLRHARRFLLEGDKVKVNLRFYGREMAHQELGMELLKRVAVTLNDIALVEVPPKMEGRQLFVLFAPDAVKIKDLEKTNPKMIAATLAEKTPENYTPAPSAPPEMTSKPSISSGPSKPSISSGPSKPSISSSPVSSSGPTPVSVSSEASKPTPEKG
jgi:translation initiation factor IF-3